jgi:hypothetical protein
MAYAMTPGQFSPEPTIVRIRAVVAASIGERVQHKSSSPPGLIASLVRCNVPGRATTLILAEFIARMEKKLSWEILRSNNGQRGET